MTLRNIILRPEWERRKIAPTHTILETRVVCRMSKVLFGVLLHLFLIHSFSTFLISFQYYSR